MRLWRCDTQPIRLVKLGAIVSVMVVLLHWSFFIPKAKVIIQEIGEESAERVESRHSQANQDKPVDSSHTRKLLVQDVCNREGKSGNFSNAIKTYMYVDDANKRMYCFVGKASCTLIKRIFKVMTGTSGENNPYDISPLTIHVGGLKTLGAYNNSRIETMLKTYYKFMFVRDPMSRLVSLFYDKIYYPNIYFQKVRSSEFKAMMGATMEGINCGYVSGFRSLVQGATKAALRNMIGVAGHYGLQTTVCDPCHVNYNFIGKQETLTKDINELLDETNTSHLVHLNSTREERTKDAILFNVKETVDNWDQLRSCSNVSGAYDRMWESLVNRGLISPKQVKKPYKDFKNKNDLLPYFTKVALENNQTSEEMKEHKSKVVLKLLSELSEKDLLDFLNAYQIEFDMFGYNREQWIERHIMSKTLK